MVRIGMQLCDDLVDMLLECTVDNGRSEAWYLSQRTAQNSMGMKEQAERKLM